MQYEIGVNLIVTNNKIKNAYQSFNDLSNQYLEQIENLDLEQIENLGAQVQELSENIEKLNLELNIYQEKIAQEDAKIEAEIAKLNAIDEYLNIFRSLRENYTEIQ